MERRTRVSAMDRVYKQPLRIVGNDNRSARRDFYDAIETFGLRDPLAKRLYLMVEPVTQGEKDWEIFRNEVRRFLEAERAKQQQQ
jgi:hypothetical protein